MVLGSHIHPFIHLSTILLLLNSAVLTLPSLPLTLSANIYLGYPKENQFNRAGGLAWLRYRLDMAGVVGSNPTRPTSALLAMISFSLTVNGVRIPSFSRHVCGGMLTRLDHRPPTVYGFSFVVYGFWLKS